jgi:hypothetical protein
MANIGEPKREIIVEPLELPEPLRVPAVPAQPEQTPFDEPVPVPTRRRLQPAGFPDDDE